VEATGSERLGSAAAINRQAHTRSLAFPIFSPPLRKPAAPSPHPPPVVFRQAPPAAPRHWLPPWTPQGSHSPPPPSSEESGFFCVLLFFSCFFFLLDNFGGLLISPQVPAHAGERVRLRILVMPRRRLLRRVGRRAAAEAPALPGTRVPRALPCPPLTRRGFARSVGRFRSLSSRFSCNRLVRSSRSFGGRLLVRCGRVWWGGFG